MAKQIPTRDEIIKAWKKADAKSDKPVGRSGVVRAMGISQHWIAKLFPGESLTDMKRQHGIRLSPQEVHRSGDELLSELDKVVSKHKRIPPWNVLIHETGISERTWKKNVAGRGGCSQEEVCTKYEEWLRVKKPNSPNLEIVTRFLQAPARPETTPVADASPAARERRTPTYQKVEGRVYGRPLHFGNLAYEPTNEQGVVFLFGMVSKALGFDSIEYMGPDFPDCEGKRRVGSRQQLQHVKIEFEFKSSNYDHARDADVIIICWEHNWEDCPLEVIELKKEIRGLRDRAEFKP
jgi:hypothetical protein